MSSTALTTDFFPKHVDSCSVKSALQGVYKDASRVDDALVQSICTAAEREGAFRAFVRILTGPPGICAGSPKRALFLFERALENENVLTIKQQTWQGLVRKSLCRTLVARFSSSGETKMGSPRWTFLWGNTLSNCQLNANKLHFESFQGRVTVCRMITRQPLVPS